MSESASDAQGHVALPVPPDLGHHLTLVRKVIERSRDWSAASTLDDLLSLAARDIAELLRVDSGYFVYRPPDAVEEAPFQIHAPWGALGQRARDLAARANAQAGQAPSPLSYLSEQWLDVDQVPPAVRRDWEAWGVAAGGSWPIVAGSRRVGALVLRRAHRASEDDSPLVCLCALHVSLLVELQDERRRVERLSQTDPLTGLLNRRGLSLRLAGLQAVAARTGQRLLLTVVDVDSFKAFNDTSGHPAGDRMLQEIGSALEGRLREADLVARLGGDEFATLQLVAPGQERAAQARLESLLVRDGQAWRATAGHAVFGIDGSDWEACYAVADRRLFARRGQGV